jgi:hypothetical protein
MTAGVPLLPDIHVVAVPVVVRGRGGAAETPVVVRDLVSAADRGKRTKVETPDSGRLLVGDGAVRVGFREYEGAIILEESPWINAGINGQEPVARGSMMVAVPGAVVVTVPGAVVVTVPGAVIVTVPGAVIVTVPGMGVAAVSAM